MQHTTFENQTFRANPQETQKLSVQRTQQIIGIVLAVFLIAGYFLFDHWQEEKQYNHSESSLYGVLKISCLLGGLLEAIT